MPGVVLGAGDIARKALSTGTSRSGGSLFQPWFHSAQDSG